MMKPEPSAICSAPLLGRWRSLKCLKNSSNGEPSGTVNGVWLLSSPACASRGLLETFTTAGVTLAAKSAKLAGASAAPAEARKDRTRAPLSSPAAALARLLFNARFIKISMGLTVGDRQILPVARH